MKHIGKLHVITDFSFQQKYSHADLAKMAIQGGADTIQFRQKIGPIRDLLFNAARVREVCSEADVTFLVNDRIDLALAVEADGVHLGQSDMPIDRARAILGEKAIIGATTPSVKLAEQAHRQGADYVGFGPIFPTKSKANPTKVVGLDGLQAFCAEISLPVIAIAGITPWNAHDVIEQGAHGIAVMSAVTLSDSPVSTTELFAKTLQHHPSGKV